MSCNSFNMYIWSTVEKHLIEMKKKTFSLIAALSLWAVRKEDTAVISSHFLLLHESYDNSTAGCACVSVHERSQLSRSRSAFICLLCHSGFSVMHKRLLDYVRKILSHTHTQTDSLSAGVVNKQQAHSCCCKCHVLWLWDRRVVSSGFTSSRSNFSSFIQTHHRKLKVLAFKRIPFFFSCRCYCG